MLPKLLLFRQAHESGDTGLDCRQFSRCSRFGPPFRIPSFDGGNSVFNTPDQLDGIRFSQRRCVGFSPGMRYTSH